MIRKSIVFRAIPAFVLLTAPSAFGDVLQPPSALALATPEAASAPLSPPDRGLDLLPEHRYQWAPSDARRAGGRQFRPVAARSGRLQRRR